MESLYTSESDGCYIRTVRVSQSRMLVKQTVFFCIYPVKLAVAPNKEV